MKIVLFINGTLGLRILDYVSEINGNDLDSVFINSDNKRLPGYFGEVKSLLEKKNLQIPVLPWVEDTSEPENFRINFNLPTLGISALFGHVLPPELVENFSQGILNLHPSLLPIGRGADPIPWSIIDQQQQGISIHMIDHKLDTGNLVFQKEISCTIDMNAGEVYELATSELFIAFSNHFPKWAGGEIESYPQATSGITFHRSSELELMCIIDESEVGTFGDFVRRLQATTFSNGKHPSFKDKTGNIWDINFKISAPHQ
jgi:methionyl-tRNA formyltransferase